MFAMLLFSNFRYVYSMRNQLKDPNSFLDELSWKDKTIIGNSIEEQINWLDKTTNAKPNEFRKRRKQLEATVMRIVSAALGSNFNQTRATSNRFQGQI